jgi:predicted ATPase
LRATAGAELSDGTLRFLYLAAALLSPRPPGLLVLNEPETGLHGPVLEPLAGLINEAAEVSQVIVTTHSRRLMELLAGRGASGFALTRSADGVTVARPD